MRTDDNMSQNVRDFLEGPAASLAFPRTALVDQRVSSDYLQLLRQPRPAVDNSLVCPVGTLRELQISEHVRVRVYVPEGSGPWPTLIYYHGGGWVTGDLDMHDLTCRLLASRSQLVVVNVDYRLAPETTFPGPFLDAYEALEWTSEHIEEYGGRSDSISVAGSSAGANLAAAVTLKARDDPGPAIAVQVLICPVTDSSQSTDSYRRNGEGLYIDRWQMQWFWDSYIPDPADRSSAYASPAHAESLEDLPPAIVVVAGLDPLVDEGLEYAARLEREANGATVWTYPGQIHGFMGLIGVLDDAQPAVDRLADALAERLHR